MEDKVEKKPSFALKAGQWVELEVPEVKEAKVEAENIPLPVVYQDDDLAVVFKPSGMVVHPAAGNLRHHGQCAFVSFERPVGHWGRDAPGHSTPNR